MSIILANYPVLFGFSEKLETRPWFPASDPIMFLSQDPLSGDGLPSSNSVIGRGKTAKCPRIRALCPWEQLEGKAFPIDLTIALPPWLKKKCRQWEARARSLAVRNSFVKRPLTWELQFDCLSFPRHILRGVCTPRIWWSAIYLPAYLSACPLPVPLFWFFFYS